MRIGVRCLVLGVVLALEMPGVAGSLEVKGKGGEIKLKVVKVVEEKYYLLTKNQPIDITIQGPVTLKGETRVLLADTAKKANYSLVLETEEGERFYSFETEISKTRDEKGRRYGKIKSLNLSVPQGLHHFRLSLFSSPKETCAVRFILERWRWEERIPAVYKGEVSIIKGGERFLYYKTPVQIKVEDGNYKFLVRLLGLVPSSESGEINQQETVTVVLLSQGREIARKTVVVERSPRVKSSSGAGVSTVKAIVMELKKGEYTLDVRAPGREGIVKIYRALVAPTRREWQKEGR